MAGDRAKAELDELVAKPPEGFDADYAKLLLAWREAHRPKPWIDRAGVMVALVASLSGAALSAFNAYVFWADRDERAHKAVFDNQVTIAKTYFEDFSKLTGPEFCARQEDALLFGRTALKIAALDETAAIAELKAGTSAEPAKGAPDADGVQAVAKLIFSDILRRRTAHCNSDAFTAILVAPGKVAEAIPTGASGASSYKLEQAAAPVAAAVAAGRTTVWIHYAAGSSDAARARALQSRLAGDPAFRAPGVQAVDAVPAHDQIRIYHRGDAKVAAGLQARLGLGEAQVVSLESAFPNLPTGIMEVWLRRGAPAPKPDAGQAGSAPIAE